MESILENDVLKEVQFITKDSLTLIFYNDVVILSSFYPFAILNSSS